MVATASDAPGIKLWDLDSLENIADISTNGKGYLSAEMAYIKKHDFLVCGIMFGYIGLYDLEKRQQAALLKTGYQNHFINSLVFVEETKILVAGVAPGIVKCWSIAKKAQELGTYNVGGNVVPAKICNFYNQEILLAIEGRKLTQFDLRGVQDMDSFYVEAKKCVALKIDCNRKRIYVGDADSNKVIVYRYRL